MLGGQWLPSDPCRRAFNGRSAKYLGVAFTTTAEYCSKNRVDELFLIFERYRPTIIHILYILHRLDAHPDQQAGHGFSILALAHVQGTKARSPDPEIRTCLVHQVDPRWPIPGGINITLPLGVPSVLFVGEA